MATEVTRSLGHQRDLTNLAEDLQWWLSEVYRLRSLQASTPEHNRLLTDKDINALVLMELDKIRAGLERLRAEI